MNALETTAPIAHRVSARAQAAAEHPTDGLHLFALVDAAADTSAWQRLHQLGKQSAGLLSAQGGATDATSPHLVEMGSAAPMAQAVADALERRHASHAFTLIVSALPFDALLGHLMRFTDVKLSGGLEMLLAIWDPAILGTLVGQADDDSLHVAGPVLTPHQIRSLLAPLAAWWYRDREDRWHVVETGAIAGGDTLPASALVLTQAQEDQLVEASVPDQVLYHLALNQPHLFDERINPARRYRFIRAILPSARQLGLEGMRDLVNFAALCLIYKQRMQTDENILVLLDQVRTKTLTMDQAMALMPE